jgi:hypothetical protein
MQHFCLIALLISSGSATAQLSPTFSFGDGETTLTFSQQPSEPNFAFTGVPYTATQSINQTQTLSTGAHVNQKTTFVSIWQDADGRKRTDQQYALPRGNDVVVSQILDPVEGAIYLLEPALSIAHRVKI